MDYFVLIGQPYGPIFRITSYYNAAGFIPSVHGLTLDGKFRTSARVVDVNLYSKPDDVPAIPRSSWVQP